MSPCKPGTSPLQCSKDMCTEVTLRKGTVIKVLKQPNVPKIANCTLTILMLKYMKPIVDQYAILILK